MCKSLQIFQNIITVNDSQTENTFNGPLTQPALILLVHAFNNHMIYWYTVYCFHSTK